MFIINSDTMSWMGETGQKDSNIDLIFSNDVSYNLISYRQEKTLGVGPFPDII